MMKKQGRILLSILFMVSIVTSIFPATVNTAAAGEVTKTVEDLEIGNYIKVGKYNGEPIVWRYMAEDELGKLIVSDKILCIKAFGDTTLWEKSYIRKWLNSTEAEGKTEYQLSESFIWFNGEKMNIYEKGFLHESNFSDHEKRVMKMVTQWTMLPSDALDLATNGSDEAYSGLKYYSGTGVPGDPPPLGNTMIILNFPISIQVLHMK